MKYPVLMVVYNQVPEQLELSKETLASVLAQDVGELEVMLVDNGSDQPTREWVDRMEKEVPCVCGVHYPHNVSPLAIVNHYYAKAFQHHEFLLGVPNDVILPPNFYRELLRWPRGIVTASQTGDRNFPLFDQSRAVSENTPMAVGLIRRWVYSALMNKDGFFFDPRFTHYCSDCDFALRIASCGIRGIQLDIQYFHYGSASHRLLPPDKAVIITGEADVDRRRFIEKWGFPVDAYEYGASAGNINFRGVGDARV